MNKPEYETIIFELIESFVNLKNNRQISVYVSNNKIYVDNIFGPKSYNYDKTQNLMYLFSRESGQGKMEHLSLRPNVIRYFSRDHHIYRKLIRKRNKFKDELVFTLEKEILRN